MRTLKFDNRPKTTIELDGEEFPLMIDMKAILEIEDQVAPDQSIYQLVNSLLLHKVGVSKQALFYRICIEAGYRHISGGSPEKAAELIRAVSMEFIMDALIAMGVNHCRQPMLDILTDCCNGGPKPENLPPQSEAAGDAPGETQGELEMKPVDLIPAEESPASPSTSPSSSGPAA